MPTFALSVALRAERPLDDVALDQLSLVLHPEDDGRCLWRDESDRALLRVAIDCSAGATTWRTRQST